MAECSTASNSHVIEEVSKSSGEQHIIGDTKRYLDICVYTGKESYVCDVCQKKYYKPLDLIRHLRSHGIKGKMYFLCKKCQKEFQLKSEFKKHYCPSFCKVCQKEYKDKYYLERHACQGVSRKQQRHFKKCYICKRRYTKEYLKKHHCRGVINEQYSISKKYFVKTHRSLDVTAELTNISSSHVNKMCVSSSHVDKMCVSSSPVNKMCVSSSHVKVSNSNSEQYFVCEVCKNLFSNVSYNHSNIYISEKSVICNVCQNEIVVNQIAGPFVCDICQNRFSQEHHLNVHLFHQCGKILICPLCPQIFTSRKKLNIHLCIHTGEKPHVCDFCQKEYVNLSALDRHLESHGDYGKNLISMWYM